MSKSDDETELLEMDDVRGRRVDFAISDTFSSDSEADLASSGTSTAAGSPQASGPYKSKRGHMVRNAHDVYIQNRRSQQRRGKLSNYLIMIIVTVPLILLFVLVVMVSGDPGKEASLAAPTSIVFPDSFDMKNNWGSLSPFFDGGVAFPDTQDGSLWPPQCKLKQVHVLHRHAERYPTKGRASRMASTVDKIVNAGDHTQEALSWLKDWSYELGHDLLVPRGAGSEYASGAAFWASHGHLLYNATDFTHSGSAEVLGSNNSSSSTQDADQNTALPLFRATDQERITASAHAWAAGFFGLHGGVLDDPVSGSQFYRLLRQHEGPGSNTTLASYYSCPNALNASYAKPGRARTATWVNHYLKAASERISRLVPGVDLTPDDVHNMQLLCAFETASFGSSRFCGLFTEVEWRGFEYAQDLEFFGHSGPSAPFSKAGGGGWLQEVLARLEKKYIEEPTFGVNTTLTSGPEVFPLDQPVYLDMSHDSVIVSVLSALGLSLLETALPDTRMPVPRNFVISRLTPFAARFFIEVLDCGGAQPNIRLVLNNRVLPLAGLSDCPVERTGLCPQDKFIRSVRKALAKVDFESVCYGDDIRV